MMSFPRSERLPRKMRPITLRWHEKSGDGRFGRRRQVSPDGAGAYPQNQLPPPLAGRPGRVVEAAHAIDVFRSPPGPTNAGGLFSFHDYLHARRRVAGFPRADGVNCC